MTTANAAINGTYHDEALVAKAVAALINTHVSVDEIRVHVKNDAGERNVPIEHRTGLATGARVGAVAGALLGAIGVGFFWMRGFPIPDGIFGDGPLLALVQGSILGAATMALVGAIAGLGFWTDEVNLGSEDLKNGAAIVSVHNDDLREQAREIFLSTGADPVSG